VGKDVDDDDITDQLNAEVAAMPTEIYASLRRLAQSQLARDRAAPTLNATALVNEAYLKLSVNDPNWDSRGHFMASMAKVMRHVMIDYARERGAQRRGGDQQQVTLEGLDHADGNLIEVVDLIAIDQALCQLGLLDKRLERTLELRFFGGLSIEETAKTLGISEPTVKRDMRTARAFINAQLGQEQ